MGVFVLVLTITDAYADIYEQSPSLDAGVTQSCELEKEPSQAVDEFNRGNNLPRTDGADRFTAATQTNISYYDYGNGTCQAQVNYSYQHYRRNTSNGEEHLERNIGSYTVIYGTMEDAPTCSNLPEDQNVPVSEGHFILHTLEDGSHKCFAPKDLAESDTCEAKDQNNAYESHMTKTSGVSCLEKDDGSICPVKLGTSITLNSDNTTYNFYSFDQSQPSDSCYKSNYVDPPQSEDAEEITSNLPSNQGECERINGIDTGMICNENPSNVCDQYGNCNEGCGTVQSGGEQIFACFSEDFDEDGVPDFKDPDRDGDGIHNDQDTDKDGDGIDDAEYTYGSGGGNSLSTLESLLGQIAQNTQGGSGGGSGNSQGVIDAIGELGEQIEESTNVTIGTKGTLFTQSEAEAEIQEATEKLNAKIEEIKEHFSGMFSIGSGTGSFSGCFDIAQINGSKHGGCIDEYADEMSMVAIALLFIFALISVVIILR